VSNLKGGPKFYWKHILLRNEVEHGRLLFCQGDSGERLRPCIFQNTYLWKTKYKLIW